ncbi:MAG: hypothetical protein AAGU17_09345 [Anaerolineaceae bacterium]|jgi:hypothetical protein
MLNSDTEILFPIRIIPALRDLRGEKWAQLIDYLSSPEAEDRDLVAFSLMMVKLGSCNACNADSFRAMRGCRHCAILTIRRHRSTDEELIELFKTTKLDIEEYLDKYQ